MSNSLQILLLKNNKVLLTQLEETGTEIPGEPDVLLVKPYELDEDGNLTRFLKGVTIQDEMMIHSDSILTIVEPNQYLVKNHTMKFYKNVDQVGDRILVRGWDGMKEVRLRDEFYPTLYVKSKEETGYTTLEGEPVKSIRPGGIRDSREFCKRYEDVENFTVYGNQAYLYQWISDNFPGEVKYDPSKIRVFTIDIETAAENGFPDIESADQEILLITVKDSFTGIYHVWGSRPFQTPQADVSYTHCADEQELLQRYLAWWTENYPDVITGWNVQLFDVPYICNRLSRILGDKTTKLFSPWKASSFP